MELKVLDMVFPRRCPVCDDAVSEVGSLICAGCADDFTFIDEPYCIKCGRPVADDSLCYCPECDRNGSSYDYVRGRAVYEYDEVLKDSIYRFKYGGRREYAEYYAKVMADRLGKLIKSWEPEALIPVPVHKSRMRKRGYNQASLLADALGKLLDIPVEDILERTEKTKLQKGLTADERQNNLKKALKIRSNDVKLKKVVLVDDIYTTGSTINAAASCLRNAGVSYVYYAAVGAAVID